MIQADFNKLTHLIEDCKDTLMAKDVLPKVKRVLNEKFHSSVIQRDVQSVYDFGETGGIEERLEEILEEYNS